MNIQVTGKRVEVTDAMREYIEKKAAKVTKNLRDVGDVIVTLHIERYRHVVDISVHAGHVTIRGEGNTSDMYTSIDAAFARIEKQVRRYRDRLQTRRAVPPEKVRDATMTVYDHNAIAEEEERRVLVKAEKIPVKPMSLEEAVMEMDLLNQEFLVFKNAETDAINVIYHRRDGNIGLIEP